MGYVGAGVEGAAHAYNVVLAEDDPDIRMLLSSALESWGYDVLAVGTGTEGLAAVRELRPDIALLDINMPGLTGPQIIHEMRRDRSTHDIPVMLITAETAGQTAAAGLADGADDYVRKPFHMGELRERVVGLTKRSRHLRELDVLREAVALPDAVRDVDGVRAVGHNRPIPGALAGGDFMAVTAGPAGTVVAFVGDVEGHGLEAAALAAFSRAVLATNAAFSDQPGLLLSLANWTLAQRIAVEDYLPMVTATCVIIDPASRVVRWASAGHPAPLFFSDREVPAGNIGLPLGMEEQSFYPNNERTLAPNEHILLYTDGLMRAAMGRRDFTESMLPWLVIAGEDKPLESVLDSIVESFGESLGRETDDDLGLLLLSVP